jgi:hypothetical protein
MNGGRHTPLAFQHASRLSVCQGGQQSGLGIGWRLALHSLLHRTLRMHGTSHRLAKQSAEARICPLLQSAVEIFIDGFVHKNRQPEYPLRAECRHRSLLEEATELRPRFP